MHWESCCSPVLVLSSTASESYPCLSHPRNPATLARDPRDRNRHLGLPGRSMSWLQNWGPAFTAGFYITPWAYLWLQRRWLRDGAFGPPMPTWSRTAFLKILFYLLVLHDIVLKQFRNYYFFTQVSKYLSWKFSQFWNKVILSNYKSNIGMKQNIWKILKNRRKRISITPPLLLTLFLFVFLCGSDSTALSSVFLHDYFLLTVTSEAPVLGIFKNYYSYYYFYKQLHT